MKNIYKIKFGVLMLLAFMLVSGCSDDDLTGESILEVPAVAPNATFTVPSVTNVDEGDQDTLYIDVTLDKPQIVDIAFYAEQAGGDASGDDFSFFNVGNGTNKIIIPAGETSGTWGLIILSDCEIEGTEALNMQFGNQRSANVEFEPSTLNLEISNYESPELEVAASWGDFEYAGETVGALVDFDIYALYENDWDPESGADAVGYAAATGSNPEEFTLTEEHPDGDYYIVANLYSSFSPLVIGGEADSVAFPVTLELTKCGAVNTVTIEQTENIASTEDEAPSADMILLAIITKEGDTYTISDAKGEEIESGRINN